MTKTQAMQAFALLSTLLILSGIRIAGDGLDRDPPRSPASAVITKNIHGYALYVEPGDFVRPSQRRLLEHPRRTKQAEYHEYGVARRGHRRPRDKLDEGGVPYRSSAVKNDEDEDEDEEEEEEEENQGNEEDKLGDEEDADEEAAQERDEEETVPAAARSRVARSGYVPRGGSERGRRDVARLGPATEECEESTEPSQYYEYETEVRNVASQDARRDERRAIPPVFGASLLILLLA